MMIISMTIVATAVSSTWTNSISQNFIDID